jgi:hypothetical protein
VSSSELVSEDLFLGLGQGSERNSKRLSMAVTKAVMKNEKRSGLRQADNHTPTYCRKGGSLWDFVVLGRSLDRAALLR